jgi:uncharacterized protein
MSNRLASETSPYLLQHADNPVDWWPWCEEALALARREDRPILLSIGYSACHWCHVMAHESFADPEVAAEMNRLFVNIKVDREERPDLDQIYQMAHQMLNQRAGGWPLTLFLTPDGTPFFGGTYFPKTQRYGMTGFPELLQRVAAAYLEQRSAIEHQNSAMRAALARQTASGAGSAVADLDGAPLTDLRDTLSSSFDERFAGFGAAPKFPHPTDLAFLLQRFAVSGDERARDMALATLTRMAEGGIYDQLGGGFCRYSVDAQWAIPHFEKMLYDNGPLLALYTDAWALSSEPLYRKVVEETAAWAMGEMQLSEGGFASSLDADSEHEEGKFYVWDREAVRHALTPEQYAVAAAHYGLDGPANFEARHWHLVVARPVDQVAQQLGLDFDTAVGLLAAARERLLALRAARVRPGRDDKVLTSWNALMIHGLARAGRVCDRADWLAAARRAAIFLRQRMWRDGRLLATARGGEARLNAYLDDHAFLILALLELLQAEFRAEDLELAEDLADALLDSFEDRVAGGFFFTRHDHEPLIQRPKPLHDNATPSGNGVAVLALQRLGHLTGENRYLAAAERGLQAFRRALGQPAGCASLALALAEYLVPPKIVVLRGTGPQLAQWQARLAARYAPDTLVLSLPAGLPGLPPVLDKPLHSDPCAWVCSGVQCSAPIGDLAGLMEGLGQ